MNRLVGEYKEDFFEVKKYIEKFSAKGSEQDEAFESLLTIYLEAQENETPVSEIHEVSAKDYAREIAEVLPQKKRLDLRKIFRIGVLAAVFIGFGIFVLFNMSEEHHLEVHGLGHVFISPNEYSVEVKELQKQAIVSFDEEYNQKFESSLKSEIYQTENGITSKGFIKNNGISADKIIISEDENSVFIEMRAERTFDEFGKEQIVSPAFPEHKSSERTLKRGYMTHFRTDGVTIKAGERYYEGAIRDIYINKKGEISFTVKTEFHRGTDNKISGYLSEGNPLELYFGSACSINWERTAKTPAFSPDNFSFAKEFYPEYRMVILQKTTSDGRITSMFEVFVNSENEIVDSESWSIYKWEDDSGVEKTINNFDNKTVSDDRKNLFVDLKYELESGEIVEETLVLGLEDAKYSFDRE